jgi:hypothetical protein
MRRAPLALAVVAAAVASLPAAAQADVYVEVPTPFLGGPIWTPLPAFAPDAAGRPSPAPRASAGPCRDAPGGDCLVLGPDAEIEPVPLPAPGPGGPGVDDGTGVEDDPVPDTDTPDDGLAEQARTPGATMPAVPPSDADLARAFGGLLSPAAADWLPWRRPALRWRARAGATYYNVQIFRGGRRVLNAWSAHARLRVPDGVLRQGRSYVWVVWPATGPRRAARYGVAVGRSTFAVTLRPRIVFRTPGTGRGAIGEVRPHIPFGTLRLRRPGALTARVPRTVTLDRRGRFALPISTRAAERLGALLAERGPNPPVGLRGPGL